MRKFLTSIFEKLAEKFREKEPDLGALEQKNVKEIHSKAKKISTERRSKEKIEIIPYKENPARDLMELMEVPFLALSKDRKNPIIYESKDGRVKVKVSRHTGHFLASIYDWDIILFVAGQMQKILNDGKDIPPRSLVIPRHEILKALHKHDGKKEEVDLRKSLSRLRLTGIETTIGNEDCRYDSGFGFLDSWSYTNRKDKKEIRITLSQWLYDGICAKGALLKVDSTYFDLTSGLKKFLYRTARKHVGNGQESWEFSIEKLYEKSGSESELKVFKNKLKAAVLENDLPEYSLQWVVKNKKTSTSVIFTRKKYIKNIELEDDIQLENSTDF